MMILLHLAWSRNYAVVVVRKKLVLVSNRRNYLKYFVLNKNTAILDENKWQYINSRAKRCL